MCAGDDETEEDNETEDGDGADETEDGDGRMKRRTRTGRRKRGCMPAPMPTPPMPPPPMLRPCCWECVPVPVRSQQLRWQALPLHAAQRLPLSEPPREVWSRTHTVCIGLQSTGWVSQHQVATCESAFGDLNFFMTCAVLCLCRNNHSHTAA